MIILPGQSAGAVLTLEGEHKFTNKAGKEFVSFQASTNVEAPRGKAPARLVLTVADMQALVKAATAAKFDSVTLTLWIRGSSAPSTTASGTAPAV